MTQNQSNLILNSGEAVIQLKHPHSNECNNARLEAALLGLDPRARYVASSVA